MTASGPDDLQRDHGLGVSRETMERLETHRRLLAEWSDRMNLVGPKELDLFWSRHALDSAQLMKFAPQAQALGGPRLRRWVPGRGRRLRSWRSSRIPPSIWSNPLERRPLFLRGGGRGAACRSRSSTSGSRTSGPAKARTTWSPPAPSRPCRNSSPMRSRFWIAARKGSSIKARTSTPSWPPRTTL